MKKLNTLFLLFFVIQSYAQDAEQNITTVPENPESLVGDSIDIQSNTIENLQKAQAQIDKLDAESKKLTNEYKDTVVEYEILNKYDNQLEKITINQAEEIANITRQIDDLDETNKYVLPLLERMVKTLRELIEIDVPFLADERYARLGELEDILFKANFFNSRKI
jgi:leucyl-tRNA synthetase